jgi:hypothetical protein
MPPAGIEPVILGSDQSQTDALEREATGISPFTNSCLLIENIMFIKKIRKLKQQSALSQEVKAKSRLCYFKLQ